MSNLTSGGFLLQIQKTCSQEQVSCGADSRTRTDDLRITNALLYQLSHISKY